MKAALKEDPSGAIIFHVCQTRQSTPALPCLSAPSPLTDGRGLSITAGPASQTAKAADLDCPEPVDGQSA